MSDAGQKAFERYHMRPADLEGKRFPKVAQPFTVEDLGGWSWAYAEVVETLWRTRDRATSRLGTGLQVSG